MTLSDIMLILIWVNYYALKYFSFWIDAPKYVTIQYWSSHKHLIEGQDKLTIACNADCQPRCIYLFYQNEKLLNKRYTNEPVHRNMSGLYTCAAKNSLMNTCRNSSNSQNIKIKCMCDTVSLFFNYYYIYLILCSDIV